MSAKLRLQLAQTAGLLAPASLDFAVGGGVMHYTNDSRPALPADLEGLLSHAGAINSTIVHTEFYILTLRDNTHY
jgi:hypothetical protein